jgi:outer membrane protein
MTWKKNTRLVFTILFVSITAKAQTARGAAAGASTEPPTRIGVVSIQNLVGTSNEGQRDLLALEAKFNSKKSELKSLSDGIDSLKKQLEVQGPKMNNDAGAALSREIDSKQKLLARAQEDAQSDFTEQQNQIVQKIVGKLVPIVEKYAGEHNFSLIIDGSKPWPEWPVLWASASVDITKAVLEIYNAQSQTPSGSAQPKSK